MGLPPTAKHPLYGVAKQEVLQVHRNQARIAECGGRTKQEEPEIFPERITMPAWGKTVWVWRNAKTKLFAPTPHHIKKLGRER